MAQFKLYKVFENSDLLARFASELWRTYQSEYTKPGLFFISSPLSSTPLPLYQWVIRNAPSFENWGKSRFILMDEQVVNLNGSYSYVDLNDNSSYERFAREKLLNPLQMYAGSADGIVLKPDLRNLGGFDRLLEEHDGIDLLILAIGARGHYAQVMPGTQLSTGFHVAKLIPEFVEQHTKTSGSYQGAKFGEYGMSLGPKQVLAAKNIVLIITGENKRDLVKHLFSYDSFNPEFPMSIIQHPRVKGKVQILLSKDVAESI